MVLHCDVVWGVDIGDLVLGSCCALRMSHNIQGHHVIGKKNNTFGLTCYIGPHLFIAMKAISHDFQKRISHTAN